MGAWAADPFGNDTACDWISEVKKSDGLDVIKATLEAALAGGDEDYLDSYEAQNAIAAADTVARLRGHFYARNAALDALDKWVARQTVTVPPELVDLAIHAVDRTMADSSESRDLWEESGGFEEWKEHLDALKERLKLPTVTAQ